MPPPVVLSIALGLTHHNIHCPDLSPHLTVSIASCVQGHVVAEQQLEVPASWLNGSGDALLPQRQAHAPGRPLQHQTEQRHGSEVVVITGANDLCVEACTLLTCSLSHQGSARRLL